MSKGQRNVRGVEYTGGGGTLQDILNIQEEMGHCERLEYAGGGGTTREVGTCRREWNMQKELGHCERCGICRRRWDIAVGVE